MKKIEITVSSAREEEISLEIMQGVYGALLSHGYDGVSINTETMPDVGNEWQDLAQQLRLPEFSVPEFLKRRNHTAELMAGRR